MLSCRKTNCICYDVSQSLALNAQFKGSCFRFANDCRNMFDDKGKELRQDIVFVEVRTYFSFCHQESILRPPSVLCLPGRGLNH